VTKEERDALFVEFVATQSAQLVHFAWLLCGDRGLAEDLVQTALEKSYRRWDRIELDNPFAYVRRAVANGYLSRQRRRLWREQPTADITEQVESRSLVGDHAEEIARRQAVLAALRRLSVRERTILVLRFHTDLTEQATADVLGISIGTVKSTTSRALAKLRLSADLDRPSPGGSHDRALQ
jgi:RNA polymerase sigma-70 factor (sigma-E family)